jgi:hypothetical protein
MQKSKKQKTFCDCLFCNSKCPECGSMDIEVDFTVRCNFRNTMQDEISVSLNDSGVSLQCNECGADLTYGFDPVFGMDSPTGEEDDRLQPLYKALHEYLTSTTSTTIEIDQKGHINVTRYQVQDNRPQDKEDAIEREELQKGAA